MGWKGRIGAVSLAMLLGSALGAAPASATPTLDATLGLRLRSGASGDFASVSIAETGDGGLELSVRLLDDLGPGADLKKLYFNLPSDVSGLAVETLGDVHTPFRLGAGRRAHGGNDSRFDFAVRFGKGRGRKGNGILREARFVIRGDRELTLSDLLSEQSETRRGIEATLALNVAGATGSGPTVAARLADPMVVPEPGTACLLGGGLLALAASRRGRG
jgi:hypothetical protein